MKKITLLLSTITFLFVLEANAQKQFSPKGIVRCNATAYEDFLKANDPKRATNQEFEEWIAPKVAEIKEQLLSGKNVNTVITIPVVVHVIHNGDNLGQNENIPDGRILSQITVLNQDFRKMIGTPGHNSNPVGADIEIEFCMAQRTPNNEATNGINRVNLGVAQWTTMTQVQNNLKAQTIWDPTKYFNIWVANFSSNQADELGGVLGYAQFPSNSGLAGLNTVGGSALTDGVIIDWRCFGTSTIFPGSYFSDFDKGRTATHEIGHCFGLRHTWGDGGCTVDDFCNDTPNCDQDYYAGAGDSTTPPVQCGNTRMIENYMDYSADFVMNIFTLDQKARVLAVLQNSPRRNTLATSDACQPLSSESFGFEEAFYLYPNPSNSVLNIGVKGNYEMPSNYTIYNNLGQVIKSATIANENDLNISISDLSNGIYFIQLQKENASKTLTFIKN